MVTQTERDTAHCLIHSGYVVSCMTDWVRVHDPKNFRREMAGYAKQLTADGGYSIKEIPIEQVRAMPFGLPPALKTKRQRKPLAPTATKGEGE